MLLQDIMKRLQSLGVEPVKNFEIIGNSIETQGTSILAQPYESGVTGSKLDNLGVIRGNKIKAVHDYTLWVAIKSLNYYEVRNLTLEGNTFDGKLLLRQIRNTSAI